MSWRLDNRRRFILFCLAVAALLMQMVLDMTRTPTRQWDYDLKLQAAEKAVRAFAAVRRYRGLEGATLDLVNDPAGTGLIGPEISPITNATGNLEAKLTSLNPNFAAVLVQYFRQAGLGSGDPVAVAMSGSFPGLNIAVFAALEAMELRPVVITSVGASNWGANSPDFTWLDMENLFYQEGIFHIRSQAATFGGGNDMGRGLSPTGRQMIRDSIERNGVTFLESGNIEEAIARRMSFFEEAARGRAYRLYVNVGGGVASLGSSHNRSLLPSGLSFELGAHNWPRKGNMILFSERGVPVVHLLRVITLAREFGLPVSPDFLPQPGEGEIFVREMYRWPLAATFLVVYCLACVLILAPELRRGLFDRLGKRRLALGAALLLLLPATDLRAATSWLSVEPDRDEGQVCLDDQGQPFNYQLLHPQQAVTYEVMGPRRIKLIARYVTGPGDPERPRFSVLVHLDGNEVLRKSFRAAINPTMQVCDQGGGVTHLRRAYLEIPAGRHTISLTGRAPGSGEVVCRLFRESLRRKTGTVDFAPETYLELATLQFESGKQSTYYRFEDGHPLGFSVTGPTRLTLYTRLDFEVGMLGAVPYSIELLRDGEILRTYHYEVARLPNGFYPAHPELLPGVRKKLTIKVPAGRHRYEIRCVRPETCGIAAKIRIPRKDLEGRP